MYIVVLMMGWFLFACTNMDNPKTEILETHEISVCGVNNPLQEIEWLKDYCDNIKEKNEFPTVRISLYKVVDKDEHIFCITIPSPIEYAQNQYYSTLFFRDCYGVTIFYWETVTPPGGLYHDFMKDKEYVEDIFEFNKQ